MINAKDFKKCIISATNNIFKHRNHINDLNIFPVPDGDTGTNMYLTISGVTENLEKLDDNSTDIFEVASVVSSSALRSSRGNSGVILSLILDGFSKHLQNCPEMKGSSEEKKSFKFGAYDFVTSLEIGAKSAYNAVSNPTEGTMLTVARVASEFGRKCIEKSNDLPTVLEEICKGARKALEDTPNLLPVLKKAGVVDAGGKGLCLILEGVLHYIREREVVSRDINSLSSSEDDRFKKETEKFDDDIRFTYCTEFIAEKFVNRKFSAEKLKKDLQKIGDCVIVISDNEVIKTHVHTNNPDKVLGHALFYGKLLNVKIDNLEEQHKQMQNESQSHNNEKETKIVSPTKKIGVLSIANGNGIIDLFKKLGCDQVLEGGQTLNPSAEQIAEAARKVPAEVVFVLPNNKNIILAAEQASSLVNDRDLIIVPSKFIPQGIAVLASFDESLVEKENIESTLEDMKLQMSQVKTGLITYAARDAEFGGFKIKKGDSLSLVDGKLICVSKNHFDSIKYLMSKIPDKSCELIDIYYPSDFSNIAEFISTEVKISSEIELNYILSGQSRGEIMIGFNW